MASSFSFGTGVSSNLFSSSSSSQSQGGGGFSLSSQPSWSLSLFPSAFASSPSPFSVSTSPTSTFSFESASTPTQSFGAPATSSFIPLFVSSNPSNFSSASSAPAAAGWSNPTTSTTAATAAATSNPILTLVGSRNFALTFPPITASSSSTTTSFFGSDPNPSIFGGTGSTAGGDGGGGLFGASSAASIPSFSASSLFGNAASSAATTASLSFPSFCYTSSSAAGCTATASATSSSSTGATLSFPSYSLPASSSSAASSTSSFSFPKSSQPFGISSYSSAASASTAPTSSFGGVGSDSASSTAPLSGGGLFGTTSSSAAASLSFSSTIPAGIQASTTQSSASAVATMPSASLFGSTKPISLSTLTPITATTSAAAAAPSGSTTLPTSGFSFRMPQPASTSSATTNTTSSAAPVTSAPTQSLFQSTTTTTLFGTSKTSTSTSSVITTTTPAPPMTAGACSSGSTTSTNSTSQASKLPSEIAGKTVEDIFKDWSSELQVCTAKARKHVMTIAQRDRRILQNRDVLIRLKAEVAKVVEAQTNLEQQLELIETNQQEYCTKENLEDKNCDQNEDVKNVEKIEGSIHGYESLHRLLEDNLRPEVFQGVSRLLLGLNCGKALKHVEVPDLAISLSEKHDFDLQSFSFQAEKEILRQPRIVRVGLIQNSTALPTSAPFSDQKKAIMEKVKPMIDAAGTSGVNILCLQEAWMMPFAFCTREKRWCEFAEPIDGETTKFLQELARKYNMVIVSPILERDLNHGETIWNTAIIIGNHGNLIGFHRKNHIPRVGDFNESTYYMEGHTGHPVFETSFGKIAVNICYGRHHPLNWLAFGLNGAEIVFNPSATVGELSEPMWPIEARNAAIANSYFVGSINRVGTEVFSNPFTSGDGKPRHSDFGHFYGSSHFSSPDASCTPSLSRYRDGLLVSDMDLNLCRQLKDKWGFRMTARYEVYSELLSCYLSPGFSPQVIVDPMLHKSG